MSGHSKWSSIKHQKAVSDKKRGQIFSKLARLITIAVRSSGDPNPQTNAALRMAAEKARALNMPKENTERAIRKGMGTEGTQETLEEFLLEAFGPEGTAVLIEGVTDNRNRSLGELRHAITAAGGKIAQEGSVRWMFDLRGVLTVRASENPHKNLEDIALEAIAAGAKDVREKNDSLLVFTEKTSLSSVQQRLREVGVAVSETELGWVPAREVPLANPAARAALQKLFSALDDHDDVQNIYSNVVDGELSEESPAFS